MNPAAEKLDAIAAQLKAGAQPPEETVQSILSWFGAERRGYWVVANIRKELDSRGLTTVPDFENVWIHSKVGFERKKKNDGPASADDPTFRIGRLDAANKPVVSVKPTDTLQRAVTLMLINDYSQLPVMSGPREVKGLLSWKTIGSRLVMGETGLMVKDCMEVACTISQDESILDAVDVISKHDYVLVLAKDKAVTGVVTASDFNLQFKALAEPFLLVGEIESGIRRMLHGKFKLAELQDCKNPVDQSRKVSSPSDLTFGEYIRLLDNPEKWKRLEIEVDRAEFVNQLSKVGKIRNDVMHFNADGLAPEDLRFLSEFAQFLKRLREISPKCR